MNSRGVASVVVVILAVVFIGVWVMRSGQARPGGRPFDCAGPPEAPQNLAVTTGRATATATWGAPAGEDAPTTYVIEAGSQPNLNNQGTFVVPASQFSYTRDQVQPGTYYVRIFARNACGTSQPSKEVTLVMP